jgi:predicted ester cyclase
MTQRMTQPMTRLTTQPMIEHNAAILHRWFQEIWNERKLEMADELLAPHGVCHGCGNYDFDKVTGPAEFKAWAQALHSAFSDIHVEIKDTITERDKVVVRFEVTMRHTGKLGMFEATQKPITIRGVSIARVESGKIVEGWNFWDQMGMHTALQAA